MPRAELYAVIRTLQRIDPVPDKITRIAVDCQYVVDGITEGKFDPASGNEDLWTLY